MQPNEEKCFTAIFRDTTKEEASELCNHPKWTAGAWCHALDQRDDARHEVAKLRAQADARPLFWYRPCGEDGLYEGPVHANSVGGKMLRDEKPGEWKPLFTHPAEAAAPGLSDDEIQSMWHDACNDGPGRPGWSRHIRFARAILTRASAATVAEPGEEAASYKRMFEDAVRSLAAIDEALGIDPDEAGGAAPILEAIKQLKAAQQQAEPGADEREEAGSLIGDGFVLEFERWNDVTGALPRNGSWLAEVSDIIQRAAQSGQRAGVAECKWSPDSDFEGDTWDSACGEKWSFIDGGPVENRVRFCQGCGGRVVLAAAPTQQQEGGK